VEAGRIHWLEARPSEAGRQVVMAARPGGGCEELSRAGENVRTRVHEYGGGDYRVSGGELFTVRFEDQRLYRGAGPMSPPGRHYADMVRSPDGNWLVAVEEVPRSGQEPENRLVAFDLSGAGGAPQVLAGGHDFFSTPCFAPDGSELAFIAWDHPDMPWDATRLYRMAWGEAGSRGQAHGVAGGSSESVVQPRYSPAGALTFVSDRSGWWNLYQDAGSEFRPLCARAAEFAGPHWVFGMRSYDFVDAHRILCAYREPGGDRLGLLDTETGAVEDVRIPMTDVVGLATEGGMAGIVAAGRTSPAAVYTLDCGTGALECLRSSLDGAWDDRWGAEPEAIEFPTEAGLTAHAFFYPPRHPEVEGPRQSRPPLLVKSHGGPTSQATAGLDLRIQYWTSRGFAVVDVNYGGSTGYGRAYRERLAGSWGIVDVLDCVNASRWLASEGRVDEGRLAISGGSAGGFTTLCALTFHDHFGAGASHYGVGDLEALARDTHKFESRYLDKLIGPYPEASDLYRARSPVHHTEQLNCPVVFFQGLEDRVVPPSQAEAMVAALARRALPHAYVTFEGEQHGFRRAENIATALDGELYFYSRVFGFEVERRPDVLQIIE
jgi:dipeptidyl aminopeptidase/acylaminoacyl peptidase